MVRGSRRSISSSRSLVRNDGEIAPRTLIQHSPRVPSEPTTGNSPRFTDLNPESVTSPAELFSAPETIQTKVLPGFASIRRLFGLPSLRANLRPSQEDCFLCAFPFRVDRAPSASPGLPVQISDNRIFFNDDRNWVRFFASRSAGGNWLRCANPISASRPPSRWVRFSNLRPGATPLGSKRKMSDPGIVGFVFLFQLWRPERSIVDC